MKTLHPFKNPWRASIVKIIDVASSGDVSTGNSVGRHAVSDRIRNYCLYLLMFILTCHAVFGAIKNGYERNIGGTRESIHLLRTSLLENENLTPAQRRKIQTTIATLVDHVSYYDLTEGLLSQFKIIAPDLYAQVDTVRDRLGRSVDVYVKFIPVDGTSVKAWGVTYIDQSPNDKDAHQSEYGEFTVSVKVWIVRRALLVLAHELGHVKYQVPNLASYYEFHKKNYDMATATNFGHNADDPSGQSAMKFGKTFQKQYADFLKISTEKLENPLDVLAKLKKSWNKARFSYKATQAGNKIGNQLIVASGSMGTSGMKHVSSNDSRARYHRRFNIIF